MSTAILLVATWGDGLHVVEEHARHQEFAGQSVRALVPDGRGGALAVVGGRSLRRRDPAGEWSVLAESEHELACCATIGDDVYVGTEDAHILKLRGAGGLELLRSFDEIAGRDAWYAGGAVVDGRYMGPPLGIRSMTATLGGVLLANVHVGGIPRSVDGGATWAPTLDIDTDVHEVRAHPSRPNIVMAAAAVGLCVSRDAGAHWEIEHAGLHAPHCSAIAFVGDDVLVSASLDPFAAEGAVYRRSIDGPGPLVLVGNGLPARTEGKADTGCMAARGQSAAICDWGGNLHVSKDAGQTWSLRASGMASPSGVLIV